MTELKKRILGCFLIGVTVFAGSALAQVDHISIRPLASNIIVPQSRPWAFTGDPGKVIMGLSFDMNAPC